MCVHRLIFSLLCAGLLWAGYAPAARADDFSSARAKYDAGDYAEALRLWRPLAEQGNPGAQFYLGVSYENGRGVPQDYKAAADWYRKAAEQGLAQAQSNLGVMNAIGRGVPQDFKAAVDWFRKAAYQGYASAQIGLGLAYNNGQGISRDYVQAHMWFSLAAVSGSDGKRREMAVKNRDMVSAKMSPAQILEAQALARDWKPNTVDASASITPDVITRQKSVLMKRAAGTYAVPVTINSVMTLDFIVDSGAAYVSIPSDVVSTLVRTGTLQASDFIGQKTFVLADGTKVPSATFRIHSLKVADITLENVVGSVANAKGSLLLGQSFLGRFQSWSIDNATHSLVLGGGSPKE